MKERQEGVGWHEPTTHEASEAQEPLEEQGREWQVVVGSPG